MYAFLGFSSSILRVSNLFDRQCYIRRRDAGAASPSSQQRRADRRGGRRYVPTLPPFFQYSCLPFVVVSNAVPVPQSRTRTCTRSIGGGRVGRPSAARPSSCGSRLTVRAFFASFHVVPIFNNAFAFFSVDSLAPSQSCNGTGRSRHPLSPTRTSASPPRSSPSRRRPLQTIGVDHALRGGSSVGKRGRPTDEEDEWGGAEQWKRQRAAQDQAQFEW